MSNHFEYTKMLVTMEELNIGIVPRSVYLESHKEGIDPFKGLSQKEERKLKRKFRKLKRKIKKQHPNKLLTNSRIREIIFWQFAREESLRNE